MPRSSPGRTSRWLLILTLATSPVAAQLGDKRGEPQPALATNLRPPPSPVVPPEQALPTLELDPELHLELVAAEPLVQDPIALNFDSDGRFWVVEMRGFMPDIDGRNEGAPVGRIRILEDTTGDGRLDRAVTFLDHLVLPRAVAPAEGGALIADATRLLFAKDLDGDQRADQVEVVDPEYSLGRNVEHQPNGLLRAIDNWFYSANSKARYRFRAGGWIREPTEFRGQWGLTQDDYGRLFYNVNYSQLHGDLAPPSLLNRNPHHPARHGLNLLVATNQQVYPLRMNTGVNRAYRSGVLDHRGRLRAFTSASAPLVYRGNQLGSAYLNSVFVCEPAGNLVKRNLLRSDGLSLQANPAYSDREFLASTDERFRPVWLATGLDGALYVVDMYRGILQHKDFMTSHLRREIIARRLDQPVHLGRIYRVTNPREALTRPARLSEYSSPELLPLLAHPNGPTRDAAQRLLVERQDRTTIPELTRMAKRNPDPLGKIHALWTLEGLDWNEPNTLLTALDDPHPEVRIAALRILSSLAPLEPARARKFVEPLKRLASQGPEEVQFHAVLALGALPPARRLPLLTDTLKDHAEHPLFRDAVLSGLTGLEEVFLEGLMVDLSTYRPGWDAVLSGLAAAVVRSRNAPALLHLLEIASNTEPGWCRTAISAGIALVTRQGPPLALEAPPKMTSIHALGLDPASLFSWPGHQPEPARQARPLTDEEKRWYLNGRELFIGVCAACHGVDGQGLPSLAPPLAHSEWVLGPPEPLIQIVLHGLEGPVDVNGIRYAPPLALPDMPALSALDDFSVASVLTYIRRAWDHTAEPVSPAIVGRVRHAAGDREIPYRAEELRP